MSLLFEESGTKKTKKKTGLSSLTKSGLSAKAKKGSSSMSIFGDVGDLLGESDKPKVAKSTMVKKEVDNSVNQDQPQIFIDEHPQLREYVFLIQMSEPGLSEAERKAKVTESTKTNTGYLANFAHKIVDVLKKSDVERSKARKWFESHRPPLWADYDLRSKYYIKTQLNLDQCDIMTLHAKKFEALNNNLTTLISLVLKESHSEVKLNHLLLEENLEKQYEATSTYQRTETLKNDISVQIKKSEAPKLKAKDITAMCKALLIQDMGFFPETGQAEALFEQSVILGGGYNVDNRIQVVLKKPEAIGKAILASSNEYLKAHDCQEDDLQVIFILFSRLYFAKMYMGSWGRQLDSYSIQDFSKRVTAMRTLSPVGFGFSEKYFEDKYKAMALSVFPYDNPYRKAIDMFEQLAYYVSPIDFCYACHSAFRELQNIAFHISIDEKKKVSNGQIFAKNDHLLCLDDLRDIALIVFLLGNPVPVASLVLAFEPFIEGLEMTSELEFAFTNMSAMVTHIMGLNLDEFMNEAKERNEQHMDLDPLGVGK